MRFRTPVLAILLLLPSILLAVELRLLDGRALEGVGVSFSPNGARVLKADGSANEIPWTWIDPKSLNPSQHKILNNYVEDRFATATSGAQESPHALAETFQELAPVLGAMDPTSRERHRPAWDKAVSVAEEIVRDLEVAEEVAAEETKKKNLLSLFGSKKSATETKKRPSLFSFPTTTEMAEPKLTDPPSTPISNGDPFGGPATSAAPAEGDPFATTAEVAKGEPISIKGLQHRSQRFMEALNGSKTALSRLLMYFGIAVGCGLIASILGRVIKTHEVAETGILREILIGSNAGFICAAIISGLILISHPNAPTWIAVGVITVLSLCVLLLKSRLAGTALVFYFAYVAFTQWWNAPEAIAALPALIVGVFCFLTLFLIGVLATFRYHTEVID